MRDDKDNKESGEGKENISRKEAILKAGKYAAFTAAAMMMILEPASGLGPPKKSPKPPRNSTTKSAPKPRTDPPPSF